jgi:putative ABC transport system permease protein
VTLVSEAMARRFWPGKDPIGKRLTCIFLPGVVLEVVGVVRDVKLEGLDNPNPVQAMYVPLAQRANQYMTLAVRGSAGLDSLANAMTQVVHDLDPDQPVAGFRTMEDLVAGSLAQKRFTMLLLTAFAGVALLLAAVGIYSVLAYSVRQRVREIGIRLALGARGAEVIRMIVLQGLKPTVAGVVAGLAGAAALSRVLARFVYGVSSLDPPTFSGVAVIVLAIGVLASFVPAWRATQLDPMATLREE